MDKIQWKEIPSTNKAVYTKIFVGKVGKKDVSISYNDSYGTWKLRSKGFEKTAPGWMEDDAVKKWAEKVMKSVKSKDTGATVDVAFKDLRSRFEELQAKFSKRNIGESDR